MNLTAGAALHQGKYLLNAHLGQDALTLTYRAIDTESGQAVVIRTLTENLRQHSEFERFKPQFLELAERLKRFKHPNLVQVLDVFEDAGCPYVVMEYVPGQTLAELIQRSVLSEAKAIDYIRQVSNALSSLHKAGLLHRDIKPQNMIRRQNTDRVVLTELGMFTEFLPGTMQAQADLLSAGYAPLEQYSHEQPRTPATDIYSLAASLYTLLYRNPPLPAPVRQKLQADGGDRLFLQNSHHVTPKISQGVKRAIWRGLEITAQKRPQTLEAWLSLLPKLEQKPTPQATLQDCLIAQSKANPEGLPCDSSSNNAAKSPAANGKTSASPTPQSAMGQIFVTKLQTLVNFRNTTAIKFNLLNERAAELSCTLRENSRKRTSLLRALLMTGAIAAAAGLGFGFALRVNGPQAPGSTFLHTEQSFPPRSDWPVAKPRL
ncbi:serine/threonine protein kinase [Microcoleus sp. FACHB-53]|jgi:serine/threonine-protein kinase|nr:serine/threonine protein kinase [Microcoleus sp. FACHB-53]